MKKFALPEDKNLSGISVRSALEEVLRDGARKMLQEAIENEVLEYIQQACELRNEMSKRPVIRNGHLPARDILTGLGPINIRQPRVRDQREGIHSQALFYQNTSEEPRVLMIYFQSFIFAESQQIISQMRLLLF